jgi:hypothetical protein
MNRREFVKLAGGGMPVAALAGLWCSRRNSRAPAKSGIVARPHRRKQDELARSTAIRTPFSAPAPHSV